HPLLPVIMFSSLTESAAAATLEALALGANDYVTKPSGTSGLAGAMQRVREELVPRLRHFGALSPAISTAPGIRNIEPSGSTAPAIRNIEPSVSTAPAIRNLGPSLST